MNVKHYIEECIHCVCHDSAIQSQLLQSVIVMRSFQLFDMNYIESLSDIMQKNWYIFHVMNYFARYSQTDSTLMINSADTIACLAKLFQHLSCSTVFYCDQDHHFISSKMKSHLNFLDIRLVLSLSDASKFTDLIERENWILKKVIVKSRHKWDEKLLWTVKIMNSRIIMHLWYFSNEILFECTSNSLLTQDFSISMKSQVLSWVTKLVLRTWMFFLEDYLHIKQKKWI